MTEIPTEQDARRMLVKIINRYFDKEERRGEMLGLANWETPPVRHILTELNKTGAKMTPEEGDAIKDIVFLWG